MAKLSAFADEVVDDFRGQVEFLAKEKVGYIEPRLVTKKNLTDQPFKPHSDRFKHVVEVDSLV